MKYKSELYKTQQFELANKIINILNLDENNQISLYDLDNNKEKTNKILQLIPDLRKYFSFGTIRGIENPTSLKRPWMSIIRQITKLTHIISIKDKKIIVDDKIIRTKIYTFIEK
jgi:hypothetical protein